MVVTQNGKTTLDASRPVDSNIDNIVTNTTAVREVRNMVADLETDINQRNAYINTRYSAVYQNGLMAGITFKSGHDRTPYNYLRRVVDIHASALVGQMPKILTRFDTEDAGIYDLATVPGQDPDPSIAVQKQQVKQRNAQKAAASELRLTSLRTLMNENKWDEVASRAATIQAWAGFCVFKDWKDTKNKTWKLSLLETPQNFVRVWSNSDFRSWDADVYMHQISYASAKRTYGDKLLPGEDFVGSAPGEAWYRNPEAKTLENLNIKKVWVIDVTGYIPLIAPDGEGKIKTVKRGDEEPVSLMIVGDKIVQIMTSNLPQYTVINCKEESGQPWGRSVISNELIDINRTMIETMSDWRTASWKVSFPKWKGIGFDETDVISFTSRSSEMIPLPDEGQDILPLVTPNTLAEFPVLMQQLWDSFTKLAEVSRVDLADADVNTASNQGLLTSMRPLTAPVEDRQKRWTGGMRDIFTNALKSVAGFDKTLDEAVNKQVWEMQVKWPSQLRKEDPTYSQLWTNLWNSNIIGVRTFQEAMGIDPDDEMDRIRDEMSDPTGAAMLGRMFGTLANSTINKSLGIPAWGYITPKVQLRGELPPQEVGNLGHNYGWDQGPFGSVIGPQGAEGARANADWENGNGSPLLTDGPNGPQAHYQSPNPTLTTDQNQGTGAVSQPGSGATGAGSQGAINMNNQNAGK